MYRKEAWITKVANKKKLWRGMNDHAGKRNVMKEKEGSFYVIFNVCTYKQIFFSAESQKWLNVELDSLVNPIPYKNFFPRFDLTYKRIEPD